MVVSDVEAAHAQLLSQPWISGIGTSQHDGESIWQVKQRIGWVAPELHIYYPEGVSAHEVVASGFFDSAGFYQSVTPPQAKQVALWMEGLGIAELAPRHFHELSSGQQRQCLLARALVKNPPLLILDEPCQGLDPVQTRAFLDLIDRLCAAAPLTLVYVSHAAAEIPACITHRLRLEKGRLVE